MKYWLLAPVLVGTAACMPEPDSSPLQPIVDSLAANEEIPAAAVIIARCGEREVAFAGVTRLGGELPVTAQSRFSLGSNSKAVLATAAAIMVEEDLINWSATIGGSHEFAAVDAEHPHGDVTLAELFSHTGGIATYHTGAALNTVTIDGPPSEQPRRFAVQALGEPAVGARGAYAYSNAGPVIAAVMMEAAAGQSWQEIVESRIIAPWSLDMRLAQPLPADDAQLYGHYFGEAGVQPYEEAEAEIAPFLQPSGYLAVTPASYARFLEHHVCGLSGEAAPGLSAEGFAALHTTLYGTPSALGWARQEIQGELFSFHIGSTGAHYAFAMVNADRAIAVLVNSGTQAAGQAAQTTLLELAAETAAPSE